MDIELIRDSDTIYEAELKFKDSAIYICWNKKRFLNQIRLVKKSKSIFLRDFADEILQSLHYSLRKEFVFSSIDSLNYIGVTFLDNTDIEVRRKKSYQYYVRKKRK